MKNLHVAALATLFGLSAFSGLFVSTTAVASADQGDRGQRQRGQNRNGNGNWQYNQNGQCNNNGRMHRGDNDNDNDDNDRDDQDRGNHGQDHTPVMIHRALAGSMERFFGLLIEHYGGNFPVWLAPVQAVVTPISEHQLEYARSVAAQLNERGLRVQVDESNEKLGYKIRHWKTQKVPYILVTGKQEAADGTVNVNERQMEEKRTVPVEAFASEILARVESKG